jgi:DHA2 family multidrug resistance protein-like MFS transporter
VLCSLTDSLPVLIAARVLQGIGAAGIMSVNSALLRFIYPRRWIGRGLGINATIGSIASAAGPSVASAVLAVAPWPWLFAVNVPLGVAAMLIAWRALPDTPRSGARFDFGSAALQVVAFGGLMLALSELGHGESPWLVGGLAVLGVITGAVLITRQMTRSSPLLPVDLMRIPLFALSVASSVCAFIAQSMGQVALPFLFQHDLALDQVMTGLLMTPWPLMVALIAPFIGRLADSWPAGLLGGIGMIVMATGLALLSVLPADATPWDIVWRMTLCGLGFGFFNTPNNRAIITSAPPARTGGASGMQASARLCGQTIGAAMVGLLFHAVGDSGAVWALMAAAGMAGIACMVSFSRLTTR